MNKHSNVNGIFPENYSQVVGITHPIHAICIPGTNKTVPI